MIELELAWAAGFFDGEGSVFVNRRKSVAKYRANPIRYDITTVGLSIAQVDVRPLQRFIAAIEATQNPTGPYRTKNKNAQPYYRWAVEGRPSTLRVLEALWPFMSEPKREQSYRVWNELWDLRRPKSPPLHPLPGWVAPQDYTEPR